MSKDTGIKIYNTLSHKTEALTLNDKDAISAFVCGPTVYDYIHIGNARAFVIFDSFVKFLRSQEIDVKYIQNLTDIDDKIIKRAKELNQDPLELALHFSEEFFKDMKFIGVTSPNEYIPATTKIEEIIAQVQKLINKGVAYLIEGDGYYFDLTKFPEYGKLSGRTTEMANDGVSRIDENDNKRNRGDFCLWKFSKDGEPSWPADFGEGRPGWHIEDTAITESYFGPQYDIHGGGEDLMFPHHEAEIAQQESASGLKPFVRYWMHNGFLVNKDEKMSKSKGNFATLREMSEKYNPQTLRYYFLSSHYRSPLNFDEQTLASAEGAVERIANFVERLERYTTSKTSTTSKLDAFRAGFIEALSDDFNTPHAFGLIFDLIREVNTKIDEQTLSAEEKALIFEFIERINTILGIIPSTKTEISPEIKSLLDKRELAKEQKDYKKSDELREEIKNLGFNVIDTPDGQIISNS